MLNLRLLLVLTLALGTRMNAAPPPLDLSFANGAAVVRGVSPGAHTAWMAVVRERIGWMTSVQIHRGLAVAANDGRTTVEHSAAAAEHAVWAFADVERGGTARGTPSGRGLAAIPMAIHATPGADTIAVEANEVRLLYVRPPSRAWAFDSADGSDFDADGLANGRVTIRLSALRPLHGNGPAPESVSAGDSILAIDARDLRSGEVILP